jgi:hypothetical protein
MKKHVEKRSRARCSFKAPVTCACFNSDRFYRAKTTNHSRDGIFFLSNFPLIPGSQIYIRLEKDTSATSAQEICTCGEMRQIGLAEVKWCNELAPAQNYQYGIGLKYRESVDQLLFHKGASQNE